MDILWVLGSGSRSKTGSRMRRASPSDSARSNQLSPAAMMELSSLFRLSSTTNKHLRERDRDRERERWREREREMERERWRERERDGERERWKERERE